MEQNKDQSRAAVRVEAVAESATIILKAGVSAELHGDLVVFRKAAGDSLYILKDDVAALHARLFPARAFDAPDHSPTEPNYAQLTRYEPNDQGRNYADFPEGPMRSADSGKYVLLADVKALVDANVAASEPIEMDNWTILKIAAAFPAMARNSNLSETIGFANAVRKFSVSVRAADAPSEPSELAKRLRVHASLFKVGCEPYADVLAAADALDSQPTGKVALDALIARIDAAAVAICAEQYGPETDEPKFDRDQTIMEIIDLRAEYEVAANPGEFDSSDDASSQPTDGGVRNEAP